MRPVAFMLAFAFASLGEIPAVGAEERYALVIGNAQYDHTTTLGNPVNDANRIGRVLKNIGFEVVSVIDADRADLEGAIENLAENGKQGTAAIVLFYSGHGIQVDGQNYLVPRDARLDSRHNLQDVVSLDWVMNKLSAGRAKTNVIMLDACRINPFPEVRSRSRAPARGLAPVQKRSGTLVAFATSPGEIADDGDGENSPYTSALTEFLQQPGLTVETMFKQVRLKVELETKSKQTPWELSSLTEEFYFAGKHPKVVLESEGLGCEANGPYRVTGVPASDGLHVRGAPSRDATRRATIPFDAVGISMERCEGDWCRIRYGCQSGWVAKIHLAKNVTAPDVEAFEERSEDTKQGLFRVVGVEPWDVLNVRGSPKADAQIRSKIPANATKVEVRQCEGVGDDKWCAVSYAGTVGYASARFLLHMEKETPPE
jgi:uncharacterized caspase-like protein/uncharacterized protein YraI